MTGGGSPRHDSLQDVAANSVETWSLQHVFDVSSMCVALAHVKQKTPQHNGQAGDSIDKCEGPLCWQLVTSWLAWLILLCSSCLADAVNLLLDTAPGGDPDAQEVARQQQQQQQLEGGAPAAAASQWQQQGRCGDQEAQLPG